MMKKSIQVYISDRLYEELSFYAKCENKSMSDFCREVLAEYILDNEEAEFEELILDD